jgi:hypothetical protein
MYQGLGEKSEPHALVWQIPRKTAAPASAASSSKSGLSKTFRVIEGQNSYSFIFLGQQIINKNGCIG